MILTSPAAFLSALAELPPVPDARTTARAAFLVAPAAGELAAESARDNRYMQMDSAFDAQRALAQHAALARALREDVPVVVFPGDASTPDAMFPNNIFATTAGKLIVGRGPHAARGAPARSFTRRHPRLLPRRAGLCRNRSLAARRLRGRTYGHPGDRAHPRQRLA